MPQLSSISTRNYAIRMESITQSLKEQRWWYETISLKFGREPREKSNLHLALKSDKFIEIKIGSILKSIGTSRSFIKERGLPFCVFALRSLLFSCWFRKRWFLIVTHFTKIQLMHRRLRVACLLVMMVFK